MKKGLKYSIVILLTALLILVAFYYMYYGYLPPRTPLKIAESLSGIDIPKSAEIVEFSEDYSNFFGNGETIIRIKLIAGDLEKIEKQCIKMSFIHARQNDSLLVTQNSNVLINNPLSDSGDLYYKYEKVSNNNLNYKLIFFSKSKCTIVIKQVIN